MANESTALATIDRATAEIEKVLETCNAIALREMPALKQAVVLATGIQQLRACLTDEVMERVFMPLQCSPLGFLTDKDSPPKEYKDWTPEEKKRWKPGYPIPVVRDCLIESLIHGLQPVGNEWNIISRRLYAAKNGLARKVFEFPGLTDLVITPGAPTMNDKGDNARTAMTATWKINGIPFDLKRDVEKRADGTVSDTRISIRANYGMGADAIIGKATRKIYRAILDRLTGSKLTIGDGDVFDTTGDEIPDGVAPPVLPPESDGKRMKLGPKPEPKPANGREAEAPADRIREPGED